MNRPVFKNVIDHTNYMNADGLNIPSVTTILKIINKEELLYWANMLGIKRKYVKTELEISAYIGTMTHKMIETYLLKNAYSIDKMNLRGPIEKICIKNAFISFLQFYLPNRNKYEILDTELSLSGNLYGGTLDLLNNYDGKLTITDYKTSKSFYPSMFLQLAGYDLLLREVKKIKVDQYMVILLDKKSGNKAKIKICDNTKEMSEYRECFKKLVDFYYSWIYIDQEYWTKETKLK